jgi:hypothetical protein
VRADQRAQLVLDRVVLGVRHAWRAPVVGVAQRHDLVGEFLDAVPSVHSDKVPVTTDNVLLLG